MFRPKRCESARIIPVGNLWCKDLPCGETFEETFDASIVSAGTILAPKVSHRDDLCNFRFPPLIALLTPVIFLTALVLAWISRLIGSSFARKRLCLTKQPESILEKFKVIFKGKVFVARAKELFTWNLSFLEPKESVYTSDDESKHGARILNDVVRRIVMSDVQETMRIVVFFYGRKVPMGNFELDFVARLFGIFYLNLVGGWNGTAIIMGDFNDVRTMDERLGSSFNASSARCFDRLYCVLVCGCQLEG
ncbi:hypothetical protein Tco_1182316 [Tanacetum coccineum]